MPNFTVAIPDDLLADAKVAAAKAGTSVNAIIRVLLEGHVRNARVPMPGNYELLLRYALGQISTPKAIEALQLNDEDALRAMLFHAGLPAPRLSLQETDAMQEKLAEMIDRYGTESKE